MTSNKTGLLEPTLKTISKQDFLDFGLHQVAYIRPVRVQSRKAYAIHAADGTPLSVTETLDTAVMTVRQNDLEAATVH